MTFLKQGIVNAFYVFAILVVTMKATLADPEIRTARNVYEPDEEITIVFSDLPGNARDWVTLVPQDLPDGRYAQWKWVQESEGELLFRGLKEGVYELRFHLNGTHDAPAVRHVFSVEAPIVPLPSEASVRQAESPKPEKWPDAEAGAPSSELVVRTQKQEYAPGEPIEVLFEGGPGNYLDWTAIVQKTGDGTYQPPTSTQKISYLPPDGERKPWTRLGPKEAGSHVFQGLDEGEYEVRFHVRATNPEIGIVAARWPFVVIAGADAESGFDVAGANAAVDASASPPVEIGLPEPGIAGAWLGYLNCASPPARKAILHISNEESLKAELFLLDVGRGAALRLAGDYEPASRRISLSPTEWIYDPRGRTPPTIVATLDSSRLRMAGEFVDGPPGCPSFEAIKFKQDDRPPHERGVVTAWQKNRLTMIHRTVCEPIVKWTAEGATVNSQGEKIPSQVLNASAFYQVTGKSYDLWSDEDGRAYATVLQQCISLLRKERDIALSTLAEKAQRQQQLRSFLLPGAPGIEAGRNANGRNHFLYLANYAVVVALRNARLYADLQLDEVKSLPDSRSNLDAIIAEIGKMQSRAGVFRALPEEENRAQIATLTEVKEKMSGALIDAAFAGFDIADYTEDLGGLKQAWGVRKSIQKDAEEYGTSDQIAGLEDSFQMVFAPLSRTVAGQVLAVMPAIEGTVAGFVKGKKQKETLKSEVIPYLAEGDQKQVLARYEERNIAAADSFLPFFANWLTGNIPPNRDGKAELEALSVTMLDAPPEVLQPDSFSAPYNSMATAILMRSERLKYEICELPAGFEEMKPIICLEAMVAQGMISEESALTPSETR